MVAIRHIALSLTLAALSLMGPLWSSPAAPNERSANRRAANRRSGVERTNDDGFNADGSNNARSSAERPSSSSLFAQSAAQALNRDFPSPDISFLLLDAHTGRILTSRWSNPDAPIPMGSLLKPFAALAYGEEHAYHYPNHTCRGTSTGCWLPRGHGDVDLTTAIAHSCNSYFRMLTTNLTADDVSPTASRFGLDRPVQEAFGAELAGLGTRWRTSPVSLARAYLGLVGERQQPGVRQILDGMALSARNGTGSQVHRTFPSADALVKTGTAACTHSRHAPGDGFAVVLVPEDDPRILLLVRVHGVPGAHTAKTAGQMLRRIEN
jgi:cell division protein FtsI/penicillin-binding protein 2